MSTNHFINKILANLGLDSEEISQYFRISYIIRRNTRRVPRIAYLGYFGLSIDFYGIMVHISKATEGESGWSLHNTTNNFSENRYKITEAILMCYFYRYRVIREALNNKDFPIDLYISKRSHLYYRKLASLMRKERLIY